MGHTKHKWEEDEERGAHFVQELIDRGCLDDPALGVAKLWVDKGEDELTEKQMYVLKEHVLGAYVTEHCTRCSQDIPWSEMLEAYDNGGLCSLCAHKVSKDD